jgi:hypothetical protein
MPAVPENRRVATLREWGVLDPLVRLSCGEEVHPLFSVSCKGPPWYTYRGQIGVPRGPRFAPLWVFCEVATGVRRRPGGLEFIEYSFGVPNKYRVLAHTEQGFWATVFDFLYEGEAPEEELRAAAAAVGFQFLDRLLTAREEDDLGTFELHQAYLRRLVAGIDCEAQQTE